MQHLHQGIHQQQLYSMQGPAHTPVKSSPKQPRASIATSEEDSIATSPSTIASQSSKVISHSSELENCAEDTGFVFIQEEHNERLFPCENFHRTGYCSLGSQCRYQHQERGVKQIRREMRSKNPIHILNEYPDLLYWRSWAGADTPKASHG